MRFERVGTRRKVVIAPAEKVGFGVGRKRRRTCRAELANSISLQPPRNPSLLEQYHKTPSFPLPDF